MIIKNDKQAIEICDIIIILTNRFMYYISNDEEIKPDINEVRQFKIDTLKLYLDNQSRISADLIRSIQDVINSNNELMSKVNDKKLNLESYIEKINFKVN